MLAAIGVRRFEDLLAGLPEAVRQKRPSDMPDGLSESEVEALLDALSRENAVPPGVTSFLGGGIYDHHIPAAVDHVGSRSEFFTAYTPYQAEVAQGTLQATYEFQSLIRRLTEMEAAQASMYDGGSALAEAALLAIAHTDRRGVIIGGALNPRHRSVLETYLTAQGVTVSTAMQEDGRTDFDRLRKMVGNDSACVIIPSPNYFGLLDDWMTGAEIAHSVGAVMVAVFHPMALGVTRTPGECGVDVAVGEGQCLGNPPAFGGPLLGLFTVRKEFMRRLPGRLVGRTVDALGQTAYVMTLQTREQHIRREKATSNICTAQALLATRAAIYMSLLGRRGFQSLAQTCMERAHYLAAQISGIPGFTVPLGSNFFNEFVIESPIPANVLLERLQERGILGGIALGSRFPGFDRRILVCVTERHPRSILDNFVRELRGSISADAHEAPGTMLAERVLPTVNSQG